MFNRFVIMTFCILLISGVNALKIEINKGEVQPDPIAIVDFTKSDGSNSDTGNKICSIIKNDLSLSGLFLPIDSQQFLESKSKVVKQGPNLKNWKTIKTRFLVYGKLISSSKIEFCLIDVMSGIQLLKSAVNISYSNIRETAHIIADRIYERITNEEGYFNTKIVYVTTANNKVPSKRTTKLMIVDQDGENIKQLTNGSELVVNPRYSPDGKAIAYIAYNDKASDVLSKSAHVYIMSRERQFRKKLLDNSIMKELINKNNGHPINMTYAPRFSSDSHQIVLAIIVRGTSAIYKLDMTKNRLTQLTTHKQGKIDTSPCFSPDGKSIVFTSDRAGKEALYIMNADGSDQHQISMGEGKYSQPVWSPRSDLIAFAKQVKGKFYIGVIKPNGSGERLITHGYLVESPAWSSNGRYIVYASQSGPTAKLNIALTDLTGRYHRLIPTPGDAVSPTWSVTYKG